MKGLKSLVYGLIFCAGLSGLESCSPYHPLRINQTFNNYVQKKTYESKTDVSLDDLDNKGILGEEPEEFGGCEVDTFRRYLEYKERGDIVRVVNGTIIGRGGRHSWLERKINGVWFVEDDLFYKTPTPLKFTGYKGEFIVHFIQMEAGGKVYKRYRKHYENE